MDLKEFKSAIQQISEEKDIPKEKVLNGIEHALAAAYKKDYGKKGQKIKAELEEKTGKVHFWREKLVVDEGMVYENQEDKEEGKKRFNPERHIMLEEAKKEDPDVKPGDVIKTDLETKKDYGRIAAQTAKQVIMQEVREAEKETLFEEYKEKEGDIISAVIQRIEKGTVYLDLGKTIGVLPKDEQVDGEFYRPGQRMKSYVKKVESSSKGPLIVLSRSYPKMVSKLFELEVPEVSSGEVEIKAIAREPGSRTKIAVTTDEEGIDPIGAMIGQKGTRVMAVINELGGEKIDVIEHSEDPKEFIENSLSPANILEVKTQEKNEALVIVPDDQLSLAIGKEGQNVRLAAKLTGWKIDVKSEKEAEDEIEKAEPKKEEEKEKAEEKQKEEENKEE